MNKQQILDKINEIIVEEKGVAITINDKFMDSELDSLGITIALITIDSEFPIFQNVPDDQAFESLDIPNLTIRELITLCRLSIANTDTEQKNEKDT